MQTHKKRNNSKKNRRRRKEANSKPCSALLDTSFQIERIKWEEEFSQHVNKLSSDHDIYSSYFVLYEFKISLIHSLIQFYYLVQLYDNPSDALMKLSDKIGREPKNQLIIQGLIQRVYDSISTRDIKSYLRKVEFLILDSQQMFSNRLKGLVGGFAGDEIVKYKIETSEDYEGFTELYKKRKSIPLDNFWLINAEKLKLLLQSTTLKKDYVDMFKKLEEVSGDVTKANNFSTNKKIGDAVIAVDCPADYTIVTIDNSFSHLCPPLGKKHLKYEKVKR